jgi:hypothetical protein
MISRTSAGHRLQTGIRELARNIASEIVVGVDRQKRRIRRKAIQDVLGEGADTGTIFDEELGIRPIDGAQHLVDQDLGRGDHRPHHHRMLDEAPEEHPERAAAPTTLKGTAAFGLFSG